MSADLENPHTLSELLEWLRLRVRWLRDWHTAHQNPKPIPPPFRDTIVSLFGSSLYPAPSDPSKIQSWANEHIWMFSEHTIHQVHDWLETHSVFGAPAWHGRDDPRILIDALDHLSELLNFVGVRASKRSSQTCDAEGEQAEGMGAAKRGRKPRADRARDSEMAADWQRARETGIPMKDFCRDARIDRDELTNALARIRMKRHRARTK